MQKRPILTYGLSIAGGAMLLAASGVVSAMTVSASFPIADTEQPTAAIFTDTIAAPKFQNVYYYRRGYYGRGYYGYRGYGRGWCYYHPYRC
jgi:hypothetical protein